jgi:ADP-ribosylglycohydrolase
MRDRALGAFYGLAIGDALGMPTQFLSRTRVAELFGTIVGFEDGPPSNEISAGTPAGRVTDDIDQAVILARTIIDGRGTVDPQIFADRLLAWERGQSAQWPAHTLGRSTRRALQAVGDGVDVAVAGRWGDTNGAAMRVTPVGIACPREPLADLCGRVEEASRLTHGTGLAISGACAVAAAVSAGVEGSDLQTAIASGIAGAKRGSRLGAYMAGASVPTRIRWAIDLVLGSQRADALDLLDRLIGTGVATQEAVPAAFAVLSRWGRKPWQACLRAAELGGDSDTIAAMTGAMAGAVAGIEAFPPAAIAQVRSVNRLDLDDLVDELLALRCSPR